MARTGSFGLRERKRAETLARLESAAVALVLSRGLENTTVEEISEVADVSPRTFFNYFDSKDSAILGLYPERMSLLADMDRLAPQADGELVPSVVQLLFTALGAASTAAALREDRAEIFRRYPQLLADKLTQVTAVFGQLTQTVHSYVARDARFTDLEKAAQLDQAELLLATCAAAVRVAILKWAADPAADDTQLPQRAVELVEQLTGRLQ